MVRGKYQKSAVSATGHFNVLPLLIEALSDSNLQVRLNVAFALSEIGSPAAVPVLIAKLNDSDWEVHASAVIALGEIGEAVVTA